MESKGPLPCSEEPATWHYPEQINPVLASPSYILKIRLILISHLEFFLKIVLAIRKNTIYKVPWWLYKLDYATMYYSDVVGYSSSDVTPGGAL
jgi:hypothetical protein